MQQLFLSLQEVAVDLGQTLLNGIRAQKERRPPGEFFQMIFCYFVYFVSVCAFGIF